MSKKRQKSPEKPYKTLHVNGLDFVLETRKSGDQVGYRSGAYYLDAVVAGWLAFARIDQGHTVELVNGDSAPDPEAALTQLRTALHERATTALELEAGLLPEAERPDVATIRERERDYFRDVLRGLKRKIDAALKENL